MANDERRTETFIREVDEELRRDQLKALWKRFAPLIIAVCVLVVAVTAGYRGMIWWQERAAARAGDRFLTALNAIASGNRAEGEAELQAIAAEGGAGYAALARLRLAGEQAAQGAKEEALQGFDAVMDDQSLSEPLRATARMRAALLALDMGDVEGATSRAGPLNVPGNPWRHIAREVLGTARYQTGDLAGAREMFVQIQEDAETPFDLRVRAGSMIALIDGQLAQPAADSTNEASTEAGESEAAASEASAEETPPAPSP
jgi:hypothetical protein